MPIRVAVKNITPDFAPTWDESEESSEYTVQKRRKAQRRGENGERVISIPETAKRGASNRNNASKPEKTITFLRQIHFPKSQ